VHVFLSEWSPSQILTTMIGLLVTIVLKESILVREIENIDNFIGNYKF